MLVYWINRMPGVQNPFWKIKTIDQMTRSEWESLCDGCARCCLHKFQDESTGEVSYTYVSCRFLEVHRCRCTIYNDPYINNLTCRKISPDNIRQLTWLPETCAYRLIAEKKDLAWWHPLVSGDPDTVHLASVSVRGIAVPEENVHPDDMEEFIISL